MQWTTFRCVCVERGELRCRVESHLDVDGLRDDDRGEEWPSDGDDDLGEWTQHWDEEVGSHYYFNSSTGEATWVQPELEAIAD